MNQRKNGLTKTHGANHLHCQPACKPQPHRPGVMQPKLALPSQQKPQPVAPQVYRPQPVPKVLQTKTAGGQPPSHAAPSPRLPVAPSRLTIQPKMSSSVRGVIQRNCGTPGCNDPNCHDPNNHGHTRVHNLRGRDVYAGNVTAADIGTGTGTNQGTRNYVNSATTPYPQEIRIEYNSGVTGNFSSFPNQPLAPGQRADAGHIFGRQFGGYGNQNASVFPQHPQTNRGNSYQGQPTRDLWRAHEDAIRAQAQSGNPTDVSVALYSTPRAIVRRCPSCNRDTLTSAATCPECGAFFP
ncbi:MAG: hypothetical protein QOD32_2932 [Pyrinomonadaceae bacterium]|jgi:hypothetical protein|nr:hypothetical protein [Pyrinomonadaceae bacterium]